MKLKTTEVDGKTFAEVKDGMPVYVTDTGETTVNVPELSDNLRSTMAEAKDRRTTAETLTAELKELKTTFADLDPAAARDALKRVKSLTDKELIDAGEAERVRDEAIATVRTEYEPLREENTTLKGRLSDAILGRMFSDSPFISDKITVPVEMIRATFGNRFRLEEDGQVTALDEGGKPMMSQRAETAGRHAGFEEALALMVNGSAFRDKILKGSQHSGGGAPGGGEGGDGESITRDAFDQLSPLQQRDLVLKKVKIVAA